MSTRFLRSAALAVGAGALVLAAAAPAMAANVSVTSLPDNVRMSVGDVVQVRLPGTNYGCAAAANAFTAGWSWTAKIPGKQDAVLLPASITCANGVFTADVLANTAAGAKKNAVVKFLGVNTLNNADAADDTKSVLTLVVHVNKANSHGKPA